MIKIHTSTYLSEHALQEVERNILNKTDEAASKFTFRLFERTTTVSDRKLARLSVQTHTDAVLSTIRDIN